VYEVRSLGGLAQHSPLIGVAACGGLRLRLTRATRRCVGSRSGFFLMNTLITSHIYISTRRHVVPLVFVTIALAAAAIVVTSSELRAEQAPPSGDMRAGKQPYRDNERIITAPDGKKFVFVRWAERSRDNVITLRVPLAHAPIGGIALLGPNYPDPNYQQPFMESLVFDAMLWDMRPVSRNRKLLREKNNMLVFGMIESIFFGSKERDEIGQLRTHAEIQLNGILRNYNQICYKLSIIDKPSRFGLRRIGAVHELGDRTPVGLHDFYFDGDQPQTATNFMSCTDDAVPDDPPPGRHENPGCRQWFALPELSQL
jgi:hypothetical protein